MSEGTLRKRMRIWSVRRRNFTLSNALERELSLKIKTLISESVIVLFGWPFSWFVVIVEDARVSFSAFTDAPQLRQYLADKRSGRPQLRQNYISHTFAATHLAHTFAVTRVLTHIFAVTNVTYTCLCDIYTYLQLSLWATVQTGQHSFHMWLT